MADKLIYKTKTFGADCATLWHKWTTAEGANSFFAEECEVELKIGGKYEMLFLTDMPKGKQGSEGCRILSFLPLQMLSFSWNAPPVYEEVRDKHTWVVINFQREGERQTKLALYHLGWQEGGQWSEVYNYFTSAWDIVFDRLNQSLHK